MIPFTHPAQIDKVDSKINDIEKSFMIKEKIINKS